MNTHPLVVGVDGSATSVAALRWALAHAARTGAPVQVVVAWEQPMAYGAVPPAGASGIGYRVTATSEPRDDLAAAAREAAEHAARETLQRAGGAETPVEVLAVQGPAGPVLADLSRDADLLVVGKSGHGAFMSIVLGSVAQHVTGHAQCPVVVVPVSAADEDVPG